MKEVKSRFLCKWAEGIVHIVRAEECISIDGFEIPLKASMAYAIEPVPPYGGLVTKGQFISGVVGLKTEGEKTVYVKSVPTEIRALPPDGMFHTIEEDVFAKLVEQYQKAPYVFMFKPFR